MDPAHHPTASQPDDTHRELVASLFETRVPAMIMSVLFVVIIGLAALRSHDGIIAILLVLGMIASGLRLAVLFTGRRQCDAGLLTPTVTHRLERRFALSYIGFAIVFGCAGARVFALPLPLVHLPVGLLIVGYAAGVAATVSLRPMIAVPSLLISVLPATVVIGLGPQLEHRISALCLAALLAGGLRNLSRRYATQATRLAEARAYAMLARRDHLTGLLNRLALTEAAMAGSAVGNLSVAVHYMDLDDFKLVNDRLGHPAGDELLRAVAARLQTIASENDMVVRLGGDEFVLVQAGITAPEDVAARAHAIEEVLATPFRINGLTITVGVSVGFSRVVRGMTNLDMLLGEADEALRARKLKRKRGRKAVSTIVVTSDPGTMLAR